MKTLSDATRPYIGRRRGDVEEQKDRLVTSLSGVVASGRRPASVGAAISPTRAWPGPALRHRWPHSALDSWSDRVRLVKPSGPD